MRFSVSGLPEGLQVDPSSGLISGRIASLNPCEYTVIFHAMNRLGGTEKQFTIKVGETICLTPPMGWNSWNCWGRTVTQDRVLASARAMVEKGLIHYGWTYINIDDAWQGKRGGPYNAIQPDPAKFPDMKALCDEIHALGLKVGIYSSPWVTTYAGFVGGSSDEPDGRWSFDENSGEKMNKRLFQRTARYSFATNDAAQWAEWGIDYLKYDWNPNDRPEVQCMAEALHNCGRDLVYSLSNSGMLLNAEFYQQWANCWRTTQDLKDRWSGPGSQVNLRQVWITHEAWMEAGVRGIPGHFPDADMLVVGDVVEHNDREKPRPSRLTADEQYTHISLWALWANPLLIGCPIETMDEFTLKLLTNREVLAVNQDAKAVSGRLVYREQGIEIIVKDLADGSRVVGLFNVNEAPRVIMLEWGLLGIDGQKKVRDLWRQQDVGIFSDSFSARVPAHGVILVRIN
jgi:alpha-galactosidase